MMIEQNLAGQPVQRKSTGNQLVQELKSRGINLNPGAWAVESSRAIVTLLGSCVAVCFYDEKLKLAGMNHFLIPSRNRTNVDQTDIVLAGDASMEVLLNQMLMRGAKKSRMTAKVFGGGTIVSSISMAIGERNAEFASEWLNREGIPITRTDTLGQYSRTIVFDPVSGDVWCRRAPINNSVAANLLSREGSLESKIAKNTKSSIELF